MTEQVTSGLPVAKARSHDHAQDRTGEAIAGIRAAFPGWSVWRSDEGCWWATRRCPLPPSQWPEGYALTVAADDARALRSAMIAQPRETRSGE
jgi:hypothetical protein